MIIYLRPIGDLRDYFGQGPISVEIQKSGCIDDLYSVIYQRWGNILPPYIWDADKHELRGPVYLVAEGKILNGADTKLHDQQEIVIMKALAGG
jgi:hypothetical protein